MGIKLATVRLLAVFGVGFQYDRAAPAGMPNGQVILAKPQVQDSDPNNCGFKVVRLRPALVAPVYWGQSPKSTTLRVSLTGASHGYWNPTPKNLHLALINVASSIKHITLNRVITLFFMCSWCAANAQPLQVDSRAMKWEPRFAEIGVVAREWPNGGIKMPYVKSDKPRVAMRINEALYMRIMGMPSPLTQGATFALADDATAPLSTELQDFTVTRNDGYILSIQFDQEGCGAYCESYVTRDVFDARTGRKIILDDVLNDYGQVEIPKLMVAESARRYGEQIERLGTQQRAKRRKISTDAREELESRFSLNQSCLAQELQKQASKNWGRADDLRFDLPAAKGIMFTTGRCSNHAQRAFDDVGEVSLTLSAQALAKMLTPYGLSLVLGTANVPEPSTVSNQVLQGKIGSAAITGLLTFAFYGTEEPSVSGIYYYNKYRKPIAVSGQQTGQTISLQEREGEKVRAAITLQLGPSGLSGHWDGDDKKLPMTLSIAK